MKSNANLLFIKAFIAPCVADDRLAYPAGPIIEDMATTLDAALTAAPDDETMTAICEDWMAAHPHLLKSIVPIPEADVTAACTSLSRRGDLVRRYGLPSVESALKAHGVAMTQIKSPDAAPGAKQKKGSAAADDVPPASKNPFSPDWKCTRPFSSPAEKEALRQDAMASVIKNFGTAGATRFARSVGSTIAGTPLRH